MNEGDLFLLCRLEPGFRHVRGNGASRSVFILKAVDGKIQLAINQPSDCLALQRDHIVCTEVDIIDVWIGFKFTSSINGPEEPEPREVWQAALHHLLNTYKPHYCYIDTGGTETGLGEEVNVEVEAQQCYRGFWDEEQQVLSLRR